MVGCVSSSEEMMMFGQLRRLPPGFRTASECPEGAESGTVGIDATGARTRRGASDCRGAVELLDAVDLREATGARAGGVDVTLAGCFDFLVRAVTKSATALSFVCCVLERTNRLSSRLVSGWSIEAWDQSRFFFWRRLEWAFALCVGLYAAAVALIMFLKCC